MFNLHVTFDYPWLFLLLIPAFALALIPYFRIAKKYRRNRNRITSIILHLIVMCLCITVLVGVDFSYEVYNSENEILLVVDASYSTEEEKTARDEYILNIFTTANPKVFKIGVVTFGYDQQYAVPLTDDFSWAYNTYLNAPQPDTTATDIAAALTYADSLFTNPEAGKIILLSDGVETDESARSVIKTISSKGIRVDTVCCSTLSPDQEVRIIGAALPDYNVAAGENFEIALTLQSNFVEATPVTVTVYDNGAEGESFEVELVGTKSLTVGHSFEETGLHALNFVVNSSSDKVAENNSYFSYMYLVTHDSVLIVEAFDGESDALYELLKEKYKPVVMGVGDEDFPKTLDALREYDEVILNNISNQDLEDYQPGFADILYSYVYEVGGGLFTVGGSEPGDVNLSHAYNRDDMLGTTLQKLLPVEAIDYTPPLGLAIVIDISGSMGSTGSQSKLDAAKDAAISIVKDESCLSERDYCGILTLTDTSDELTNFLPMTEKGEEDLLAAIRDIDGGGGTKFQPAILRASRDLRALYTAGKIQKMHVIIITDGGASDYTGENNYPDEVKKWYGEGVTFSFVAVSPSSTDMEKMNAVVEGLDNCQAVSTTIGDLTIALKDDIRVPEIKDVIPEMFTPTLNPDSSYGKLISQESMPSLGGFYGTKVRSAAELVLYGNYGVPVYAQWKFGEGMVGSFMCDLIGNWSGEFMSSETGQTFLYSVINKLFPVGNIRANDTRVSLREGNYTTQVSIYTKTPLAEDESIRIEVSCLTMANADVTVIQPSAGDGFSRATIVIKQPGVYQILVRRYKGETVQEKYDYTLYKTFSYSAEYNVFQDVDREQLMSDLAADGLGIADKLEGVDPYNAFEGFITSLHKNFDPRFLFMILTIILFLLDVAVRKFKFKWPHEIIREIKEKRSGK